MPHSMLCGGNNFFIIFWKLKLPYSTAWRYQNSLNGILLPIIHKINVHHHKYGKVIFDFFAGPYLCVALTTSRNLRKLEEIAGCEHSVWAWCRNGDDTAATEGSDSTGHRAGDSLCAVCLPLACPPGSAVDASLEETCTGGAVPQRQVSNIN